MPAPKFISLTEVYSDRTTVPLILNAAYIMSVKNGKQGNDTLINMACERIHVDKPKERLIYFVTEPVDEVWRKING